MKLNIPKDQLLNPIPPRVFLCNTNKKIIGELPTTNRQLNGKWNSYSEFSFDIQRTYVDVLTGETKIHPLYDKVEAPRNILVEGLSYFALQDIDDTSSDNDVKSVSAFSLEYTASNKYLTNWNINTGEVDSKEVLYNEELYGIDYNTDADSFYQIASGTFDPYESYYQKVYSKQGYSETNPYVYEQVQVVDEQDYNEKISNNNNPNAQPHEKLYVKKFANVQFYNPNKKGLSLLHLIFENIPEWKIGNVDQSLWRKERKFSEDRISVYDFIQNNIHDTFNCVAVWDSLTGLVHFYEELEDDAEEQNDASTRFETDVFISKDNLASEVKVSYSSDNIKTKLVVTGSDDLNIREANLGRNEIMDLSFYHNLDWMEPDLYEAYNKYLETLQEAETGLNRYGLPSKDFPMSYPDAMKGWVAANNSYTDIMNAVPVEGNVVLVGDEFKKLYCTYTPISNVYYDETINVGTEYVETSKLYTDANKSKHIPEPSNAKTYVTQNVLLIYDKDKKMFKVDRSLNANELALVEQLNLYHVDEDTDANKSDNILLKLKHPTTSDNATIRIYDKRKVASQYYGNKFKYYAKGTDGNWLKTPISIVDGVDFNNKKSEYGDRLYTNNYQIQVVITRASTGASTINDYSIIDWINNKLDSEEMALQIEDTNTGNKTNYKISSIGTMGAYFVLAKDEKNPDNLQDYGVKLLEEKHKTYTTIFQTQTEQMLSKEKSQCIVQPDMPEIDYPIGTRWLDTDSSPAKLMELKEINKTRVWQEISAEVSEEDLGDYENYQRYIDNYEKLQAVQQVLTEKKNNTEYSLDGHMVPDRVISVPPTDGSVLSENMELAAISHFNGYSVAMVSMDTTYPLYTFVTSFDPIEYGINSNKYNYFEQYYIKQNYIPVLVKEQLEEGDQGAVIFGDYDGTTEDKTLYVIASEMPTTYKQAPTVYDDTIQYYVKNPIPDVYVSVDIDAETFDKYDKSTDEKTLYIVTSGHRYVVYLKDSVPYIAYENSQGVYNMIMNYIRDNTEMNKFFTVDQWIRLSPFIKEDEFNDSNFFITEYDSEEERQRVTKELMEAASKELKTLCKPSLEFSMTMANILALPEFEPLFEQFQLGNFIKVEIRDGYVKRARLLEVNMNFDDLSSFDCTFGNLVTTKSEIDKHADLLKTAVTAGKQVAKVSGSWQKAVDKTNELETSISDGLKDAALSVASSSGQSIVWDERGILGRKLIDGTTDQYEPEQYMLTNNKLVFTNSNWESSKGVFGNFNVAGENRWGVLADAVVAGYIESPTIKGGTIEIGEGNTKFVVNPDGSVEIRSGGTNYVDAMKEIEDAYKLRVELEYNGSTIFTEPGQSMMITCKVFYSGNEVTSFPDGTKFEWMRISNVDDSEWNQSHTYTNVNTITITNQDIEKNARFYCKCTIDESKLS